MIATTAPTEPPHEALYHALRRRYDESGRALPAGSLYFIGVFDSKQQFDAALEELVRLALIVRTEDEDEQETYVRPTTASEFALAYRGCEDVR